MCPILRFFINFATINRAENSSKKKRGTRISGTILTINNLNLFVSQNEKAKPSLVPIKTHCADYEIREDSASESNIIDFLILWAYETNDEIFIDCHLLHVLMLYRGKCERRQAYLCKYSPCQGTDCAQTAFPQPEGCTCHDGERHSQQEL